MTFDNQSHMDMIRMIGLTWAASMGSTPRGTRRKIKNCWSKLSYLIQSNKNFQWKAVLTTKVKLKML